MCIIFSPGLWNNNKKPFNYAANKIKIQDKHIIEKLSID